jgi:hypothetical protein
MSTDYVEEGVKEVVPSNKGKLVTWAEAADMVDRWFADYIAKMNEQMLMAPVRPKCYKRWKFQRICNRIAIKQWGLVHMQLYASLLPQHRKRIGLQRIHTLQEWRGTGMHGDVEVGTYSGMPAWRRPPGRPAKSATEIMFTIMARRERRRLQNKTSIRRRRIVSPVKLEFTAGGRKRPTTGQNFGRGELVDGTSHSSEGLSTWANALGGTRELIIEEITKEVVKYFIHWAWDASGAQDYIDRFFSMIRKQLLAATGDRASNGYQPRLVGF